MAKKKSKAKTTKKTTKITTNENSKKKNTINKTTEKEIIKTEAEPKTEKKLNKYQKSYQNNSKTKQKTASKNKQIVDANEVIYNVPLNNEIKKEQEEKKEVKIKYIGLKEYLILKFKNLRKKKPKKKKTVDPKTKKLAEKEKKRQEYKERLILNQQLEKKVQKIEKDYSKYNIVVRTFVLLYRNLHIIFNSVIILSFIVLIYGAFKVEVYETNTILYFGGLLLFLTIVAISQNKYLSGKIFTILLVTGMTFVTVNIQKTYNFLSLINPNAYEYKTYYIAAIDIPKNRSIHSLNNKKICVLKDISESTSKVIDTKVKNVTYLAYNNTDLMFEEFYSQKCRGIVVTKNQYKYLESNPKNSKKIKQIHEFKAVTKK